MNTLNVKQLKALAKKQGIKGYYKLRKAELIEMLSAVSPWSSKVKKVEQHIPATEYITQTSTVKQLKALVREQVIKGYYRLVELIKMLNGDAPVVSRPVQKPKIKIEAPRPSQSVVDIKPVRQNALLQGLVDSGKVIQKKVIEFGKWFMSYTPAKPKIVDALLDNFKTQVETK